MHPIIRDIQIYTQTRLREGEDHTINYEVGVLTLIRVVDKAEALYVTYTPNIHDPSLAVAYHCHVQDNGKVTQNNVTIKPVTYTTRV